MHFYVENYENYIVCIIIKSKYYYTNQVINFNEKFVTINSIKKRRVKEHYKGL